MLTFWSFIVIILQCQHRQGPARDAPFYTRHLISVNYKVVSQLSQTIFLSFSYLDSVQHNLFIELFHTQWFSKITYSFVAIESLSFKKNAKFHFYCSREHSLFVQKKTSYVKMIDCFAFCVWKNFSQKIFFEYTCTQKWLSSAKEIVAIDRGEMTCPLTYLPKDTKSP